MKMSKQFFFFMTKNEKKNIFNNLLCVASWISKTLIWICGWLLDLIFFLLNTQWLDSRILYKLFQTSQISLLQILSLMKVYALLTRWYRALYPVLRKRKGSSDCMLIQSSRAKHNSYKQCYNISQCYPGICNISTSPLCTRMMNNSTGLDHQISSIVI